ncbi:hypothetical protein [Salinibacter ruber]|uniref:hypothetical protein n=1 Tax=Salinibacter ruber TaxID=146919 RepID=UPI0021670D76|nr:hypothetical protein [Salinibacter ruber]
MGVESGGIIDICSQIRDSFDSIASDVKYQAKGVFHSEMLLVCAITEALGVSHIVESGRARGQSTYLLARYFDASTGCRITSVEYEKYTRDAIIAMNRLRGHSNVDLQFGDSWNLLPSLCTEEECIVVIDGPKGRDAVQLAARVLRNPEVRVVFIHDLHAVAAGRKMTEQFFPDSNTFFTDDEQYVEAFRDLDERCWEEMKEYPETAEGWAPYLRHGEKIPSYAHTFAMIVNTAEGIDVVDECTEYAQKFKSESTLLQRAKGKILNFLESEMTKPYWALRYWLQQLLTQ